jgi:predicted enzyme related to lactoylglutathione lyase
MSSLVIFAVNVKAVADFYEAVLGLPLLPKPGDSKRDLRLGNDREEILIHSIPPQISQTIVLESPPIPREESAMKPIFDVKELSTALEQVSLKGGVVTERTFTLDGLIRHDVVDPEGNIVQLRSSLL